MEVALIPGVLALGESIACQLAYAVCEYDGKESSKKSHPGIYSNPSGDEGQTRSHSGIYCNTGVRRVEQTRVLPPVAENHGYYSESRASGNVPNHPMSSRSGSETESPCQSPCPTARLALPAEACRSSEVPKAVSLQFDDAPGHSPCTASLLMPTERLCPPRFGVYSESCERDEDPCKDLQMEWPRQTSTAYLMELPPLKFKHVSSASNSTMSTCSEDLDNSRASTISFAVTNNSDQQSPRSICNDADSLQLGSPSKTGGQMRLQLGASPVDQKEAPSSQSNGDAPVSKARQFCRQAFADCDLGTLDDEMAELTKDLEAIRATMASSRRLLA